MSFYCERSVILIKSYQYSAHFESEALNPTAVLRFIPIFPFPLPSTETLMSALFDIPSGYPLIS